MEEIFEPRLVTSSTFLLKGLVNFAMARGADTKGALADSNIEEEILSSDEIRIPIGDLNRLWNEISRRIEDPFLGLHFGESLGHQGGGHFLFALMRNCRNLGEAIDSLIRYHGLVTDLVTASLSVSGDLALIDLESQSQEVPLSRHLSETVLSLLATVLGNITDGDLVFREVHFSHDDPGDTIEYERIFSVKPRFRSAGNRLVFDSSALLLPFPLARREFQSYLLHYAETLENRLYDSITIAEKISFYIKKSMLGGGDYSLKGAASSVNLSQRHVQNKLKEENTTYQELLNRVRKELALHFLKKRDVFLIDIAFALGFAEQSSFNHAFKKWTGMTPRAYRDGVKPE